MLVHGPTPDGEGVRVLRKQGETLSAGEVRPVKEGKPLSGEMVRMHAREGQPHLYDVEVLHEGPKRPAASSAKASSEPPGVANLPASTARTRRGPAQVSSDAYRAGWTSIWGGRTRKGDPTLN